MKYRMFAGILLALCITSFMTLSTLASLGAFPPASLIQDALPGSVTHTMRWVPKTGPEPQISSCTNCIIKSFAVGDRPQFFALDPQNERLYLSDLYASNVTVIDTAVNAVVGSIPTGSDPWGDAYDATNGLLYVANNQANNVSVINTTTESTVNAIPLPGSPVGAALDGANGELYVAIETLNETAILNLTADRVVGTIPVGTAPWDLIYDARDGNLYTTNANSNNVTVINGSTNRVVANVPVGTSPSSICYQSHGNYLYVANPNSNDVTVINSTTNSVVTTISTSHPYPRGVVCDPVNGLTYVMDEQGGTIDMINGTTNALVGSLAVGTYPNYGLFDPQNGYIYVAELINNRVYVIAPSGTSPIHILSYQASPPTLVLGGTTYLNVTATGGTTPYAFTYTGLPKGCASANTSTLTCTPTATGSFAVRVYVNDSASDSSTTTTNLTVLKNAPTLASVSISPTSATIPTGGSASFTAIPSCSGGPCPSGATYAWTLTNGLGTLASATGVSTQFTAGPNAGTDTLFVNATLNSVTQQSPGAAITITSTATLASVSISPSSATIGVGGTTSSFTATPACSGGPCPSGTTYSWTLSNGLGALSAATGSSTQFTAGPNPGTDTLFVNATLNSITQQSAGVPITIVSSPPPTLASVSISPVSAAVGVGTTTAPFTATPACNGGSCPSGATFSWTLTNNLGTVTSLTGTTTQVTAGAVTGTVTLFVNASLNSVTQQSTGVPITITSTPTLSGVSISPHSTNMGTGGTTPPFTATPTCTGGGCPSGITYAWVLSNPSLGTLSSATGNPVTFTAGSATGTLSLSVNASLNGVTTQSTSVPITITLSGATTLTSVTVTPPSWDLNVSAKASFMANASCSANPCAPGVIYSWNLTDGLATLSSFSGSSVTLTAGTQSGKVTLFVNATLGALTLQSAPVSVTVLAVLASVSVTPGAATVVPGSTVSLLANASCQGGSCPTDTLYSWSLTDGLGSVNTTSGARVSFTAGTVAGSDVLFVNATLLGKVVQSSAVTITIAGSTGTHPKGQTGFLGLPGNEGFLVLLGVLLLVVIIVAALLALRRSSRGSTRQGSTSGPFITASSVGKGTVPGDGSWADRAVPSPPDAPEWSESMDSTSLPHPSSTLKESPSPPPERPVTSTPTDSHIVVERTIGPERNEENPFEGEIRPEEVNPNVQRIDPKLLQPMEMRVARDRGADTRDTSVNTGAEKRTEDLMARARKARQKGKDKYGVERAGKPPP